MAESGNPTSLHFISPTILQRLVDGTFVPKRASKPASLALSERRDTVSPLAVAKRCIRYEPLVFFNRRDVILGMAESLNQPTRKIILVSGRQGSGKTSLARGLIELMGGGKEQLLWFDVSLHSEHGQIIQFLIDYITFICSSLSIDTPQEPTGTILTPLEKLERWLGCIPDIPLLLAIDNMEHMVDGEFRITSQPFKEMLNFLLSFDNIKIMLLGESLPFADISSSSDFVHRVTLSGLPYEDAIALLKPSPENPHALDRLYEQTQGIPWLLRSIVFLYRKELLTPAELIQLSAHMEAAPNPEQDAAVQLVQRVLTQLSAKETAMMSVLAFLRHPVDYRTLVSMSRMCFPEQGITEAGSHPDDGLLKPFLKKTYPPQMVLAHIRERLNIDKPDVQPWYELYRQVRDWLYHQLPEAERVRIHERLQRFYQAESNKPAGERQYAVSTKALVGEANFHGNRIQRRKDWSLNSDDGLLLDTLPVSSSGLLSPKQGERKEWTLEDYRQLQVPDSESELFSHADLTLDSFTDEEKRLLGISDSQATGVADKAGPTFILMNPTVSNDPNQTPLINTSTSQIKHFDSRFDSQSPAQPLPTEPPHAPHTTEAPQTSNTNEDNLTDPVEGPMHKALARAVEVHDKIGMATQLIRLAQSRLDRGLVQGAEECLNKAMDVEQSDKGLLPVGISGTLYSLLGTIHAETYRHNSAMTYLGRALHLMEGERAPKLLALCVEGAMKMADIQFFRGKYPEAEHLFRKALNACQSGGRKELEGDREAEILFRLAEIYDMNGSVQKALSHYQASLALDEAAPKSMNRAASCASTLANMGAIHVEQQAWSQAEDCFRRSLRWDRQANNREGMHKTLLQLADIYLIRRQYPFAERVLKQALALALQANRNPWKASTYLKLGDLSLKLAKPAQALEYYASARKVAFGELSEKSLRLIEQKILEARRAQSQ